MKAELVRVVLDRMFYFLRSRAKFTEEQEYEPAQFGNHLRKVSPDLAPKALQGLYEDISKIPARGWDDIEILFEDFGHSGQISRFEEDEDTIYVNDQHEFFKALDTENVPEQVQNSFREAVIGPLAMEGLLRTHYVEDEVISEGRKLVEQTYKTAARYIQDPYERLSDKIETKSFEGDDPFERAIVEALDYIGLDVEHRGEVGHSDAIIIIPRPGGNNVRLSVEAKGKKDEDEDVTHDDLKLSTASGHSLKDDCDHVLIVARSFQTNPKHGEEESQLNTELKMEKNNDISVLTVAALQRLLQNHSKTTYTYEQLNEILTHQELPEECEDVVDEYWEELAVEDDIIRLILEAAWEEQKLEHRVKPSIRMVYRHDKVKDLDIEDNTVESVLHSAQVRTGLVDLDRNSEDYTMLQHPDQIIDNLI